MGIIADTTPMDITGLLGDTLVAKVNGKITTVNTVAALEGKFVLVYFSAHWCPPCRSFTPLLRSFYSSLKGKLPIEVVFVSSDNSPAEFEDYFTNHMSWLAVPYEKVGVRNGLSRRFKVMGIPTLSILDPNGQVVNRNARASLIKDQEGKRFPWAGEEDNNMGGGYMPFLVLLVLGLFYWLWFGRG